MYSRWAKRATARRVASGLWGLSLRQKLLEKQLECGIAGNPISYSAPDGMQRIAVYTGTGWLAGGFAGGACPADGGDGGRVHVFKLS